MACIIAVWHWALDHLFVKCNGNLSRFLGSPSSFKESLLRLSLVSIWYFSCHSHAAAVYITLHSFLSFWQVGFQHDTVWKKIKDGSFTSENLPPTWDWGPVICRTCRFPACKVFFHGFCLFVTALHCSFFHPAIFPQELLQLLSAVRFLPHTLPPLNSSLWLFSTHLPWIPAGGLSVYVCVSALFSCAQEHHFLMKVDFMSHKWMCHFQPLSIWLMSAGRSQWEHNLCSLYIVYISV